MGQPAYYFVKYYLITNFVNKYYLLAKYKSITKYRPIVFVYFPVNSLSVAYRPIVM